MRTNHQQPIGRSNLDFFHTFSTLIFFLPARPGPAGGGPARPGGGPARPRGPGPQVQQQARLGVLGRSWVGGGLPAPSSGTALRAPRPFSPFFPPTHAPPFPPLFPIYIYSMIS